ncbi:TerD family protein [Spartinivicinus ruber]|uniref:TerD family protein n=1 Tax=Spartinivicinus ruber TaxID=2683272 RepID=UPI0013D1CC40|nr:TerD family protein [Spartinivicinus ruber]
MKELISGQKIKLDSITHATSLTIEIQLSFKQPVIFDISCFGLDANNQLSDDRYMIFYNQVKSPCSSLRIEKTNNQNLQLFKVDLANLPSTIKKIVFVATIDGEGNMSCIENGALRIADANGHIASFGFQGSLFNQEKAIMIGEIYYKDVWRFGAMGQGFNGGLSALLKHFGGEELTEEPKKPKPVEPSSSPATIKLSKITLEKRGDKQSISLEKTGTTQVIKINLNWDKAEQKKLGGLFKSKGADLDLGCMYRLKNGKIGVIQPLDTFGDKNNPPYILLDKDDRSGQSVSGENLTIYRPDQIEFIMIFAMIYEGARDFTTVNGRLTIIDHYNNEINIKLDAPNPNLTFCAACCFQNTGNTFDLRKEELYFKGHQEADNHFGFGFTWRRASK